VPTKVLGERLRELRERAGLSQAQLAAASGLPIASIRNWEYGRREPLLTAAGQLAAALGVEVGDLLKPAEKPAEQATAEKPRRGRPPKAASEGRVALTPAPGQRAKPVKPAAGKPPGEKKRKGE
jgi:transcriptional regulator with XRE-family HTH domain